MCYKNEKEHASMVQIYLKKMADEIVTKQIYNAIVDTFKYRSRPKLTYMIRLKVFIKNRVCMKRVCV